MANLTLPEQIEFSQACELFHKISRGSTDTFILTNKEHTILFSNQPFAGLRRDELYGKKFTDLLPQHRIEGYLKNLPQASASEYIAFETAILDTLGNSIEFALKIRSIEDQGVPDTYLVVATELTSRRQAETATAQLMHGQHLDIIGQLAGGLAHDLNNKFAAILLIAQSLSLGEEEEPNAHLPSVSIILDATMYSIQLIKQLILFGRSGELDEQDIEMNNFLYHTVSTLRHIIPESIELGYKPTSTTSYVNCDPIQLKQILFNLVLNARDSISQRGSVLIESGVAESLEGKDLLIPLPPGNYFWVEITDSGCGIEPNHLPRIFDPFFTTKEVGKGSGLGLSVVYGILKKAKGSISVHSKKGEGTRFRFYLPLVSSALLNQPESSEMQEKIEGTILLVEDDPIQRSLIADQLEVVAHKVVSIDSAKAAMSYLKDHPNEVKVVITDIVMPGISGFELAKHIAEKHPQVGIVFITGHWDSLDRLATKASLPTCVVIRKPLDIRRLVQHLINTYQITPTKSEAHHG